MTTALIVTAVVFAVPNLAVIGIGIAKYRREGRTHA